MDMLQVIARRRDGLENTQEDLELIAKGAASGSIPDYQLAAWLMAAYLRPLDARETADFTLAIANSGERLDLSALPKPHLDKHSTGGVGDKTSIVLLPLLAACGATVVKMSGRGLGITGGTVDKLGSVPGFRLDSTPDEMVEQARRIGVAITGQTPRLAPADKALYALRDATATVDSIPLIVSSILSKKVAGGAETIVLDVKCGAGAFMPDIERARELASALKSTADRCGLNLRLAITDMDQPLGKAVGNALEVKEAVAVIQRKERGRFRELCVELAGLALEASGICETRQEGRIRADEALESRAVEHKARRWFEAQGASATVFEAGGWSNAPIVHRVEFDGEQSFVSRVDAQTVGRAVLDLGGGRKKRDDSIDPRVGVVMGIEVGSVVRSGDALFEVHAAEDRSAARAAEAVLGAIRYSNDPVLSPPVIMEVR